MLAWLDYAWVIEIFNVLVRNKIRTRHLPPPPPLPNIVRIAMHIYIYGRSLKWIGSLGCVDKACESVASRDDVSH